ncbi:MAG TPA: energy transducer TonB [Steroidobacteraceae bacterium]|jgi:protein TonB|nr:energy transducer TonB [Steroidobacteraceae bacterium]
MPATQTLGSGTSALRGGTKKSTPRRTALFIVVAAFHVLIVYGLMVATGVVHQPAFVAPIEAVFIPEATQPEQPQVKIKPEIDQPVAVDQPPPEVQFEEAVTPPSDVPVPASANAISGSQQQGAPAQDLKTANRVEPTYPPASRRAGEQGTVRLKVLVDTTGRPANVAVTQSSGFPRLDEAAVQAVRKWRFQAATDGSKKIQAYTQVAVTFRLTEGEQKAAKS